jgi:site-specific recombinase XerD
METELLELVRSNPVQSQADNDNQVVQLWIHGRSQHTQRAYRANANRLFTYVGKSLALITLSDLQAFQDSLTGLAPSSQAQTLAAVKSLLAFARKIGYLTFNVGAALQLPKTKNTLAERILQESEVHRMFALEPNARNRMILKTLYYAGLRVSELCGLRWRDLQSRGEEGQMTVFGKGGKTRAVLLPLRFWNDLLSFRGEAGEDDSLFQSRAKAGHPLDQSQVLRIVRKSSARAGNDKNVSPHWLRHAHASHSLDRGAPIHLVQATLGHASVATTGRYLHARPTESSGKYLAE